MFVAAKALRARSLRLLFLIGASKDRRALAAEALGAFECVLIPRIGGRVVAPTWLVYR